jgi:hypothetical protein
LSLRFVGARQEIQSLRQRLTGRRQAADAYRAVDQGAKGGKGPSTQHGRIPKVDEAGRGNSVLSIIGIARYGK